MENKNFDNIEHEIIYNKLVNYYNKNNVKYKDKYLKNEMLGENYSSIETMKQYKDVYAHRLITSHRRYAGNIIVFLKKVVRRCLKWYINPITEQQTIFNNATLETIENSISKVNTIEVENGNIEVTIKKLESETAKIKELESQLARITELENKVAKINDVFKLELNDNSNFFEKKTYAQAGEDTILAYVFFALGINNEEITYIDLGANHAKELSNTYYFYENGAKGVLVEANPKLIQELSFYRHNDVILNSLVSEKANEELDFYILSGDGLSTPDKEQAEEACKINTNLYIENVLKVRSITVNSIIEKYFGGVSPKFISIDIEGHDFEVLQSIDLDKYRPLVIVVETIEYRPYLPIKVKKDEAIEYLKSKDYIEYAFTGINSIFIDAKHMRALGQEG